MNACALTTNIRQIAVFRALNLGDMLCTVPALRALRKHYSNAHIALIGLASAKPVLEHFPGYVDEWIEFPGDPAFPERKVDEQALPHFYQAMRARGFDLIVQLHGSGPRSNEIVQAMAPRQWAGFVPNPIQAEPGRLLPWPDHLHEIHRYLALLQHMGIDASDDTLEFSERARDMESARALAGRVGLALERTVFIHPGARLPSRRWPIERFSEVGRELAREGWQIAVTGSDAESAMAQTVADAIGPGCINLCGATDLGVLAALLRQSRLLVCNDTGISHVAAAVKLPSVVVASGSDVRRWAPLDTLRHTVLHVDTPCRPCAYDVCPTGHECARGVEVEHVLAQARRHLQEACVQ